MFIVTVVYASGLKNRTIGTALLVLSLVYPFVILLGFLGTIRKLNYIELRADGIYIRNLGYTRKLTGWSDIRQIDETYMSGVRVLGIVYANTHGPFSWIEKYRLRTIGWAGFLPDSYSASGVALANDIKKWLRKYGEQDTKPKLQDQG